MVFLLSAGSACAFGALLISLWLGDRGRVQSSAAVFAALLLLLLAELFPQWGWPLGIAAIIAAIIYAVTALRNMRRASHDDTQDK